MRKVMGFGLGLILSVSAAWAADSKPAKAPAAKPITGTIDAKSGSTTTGTYTISEAGKQVTLKVAVEKAPPGEHAVHIHETGDCSAPDAKSAGGHWNPSTDQHGQWQKEHHHLGDIGNLKVGPDGKGEITLTTDKWTVGGDPKTDMLNHAIVVHEKIDDFVTQPTGNAGSRIGCGVIKK